MGKDFPFLVDCEITSVTSLQCHVDDFYVTVLSDDILNNFRVIFKSSAWCHPLFYRTELAPVTGSREISKVM